MKTIKRSFKWIMSVTIAALFLIPTGCEKSSPLNPDAGADAGLTSVQPTFLKSKTPRFMKPFSVEQLVSAANGGLLTVGDEVSGYSSLSFEAGDLPQDTLITFGWDSQGYITDLGPHGIVFNNPVEIRLSYKDADLTGVNEDNLRLWYYHEDSDTWELIGGNVDKTNKIVYGTIAHFSRYAIGLE